MRKNRRKEHFNDENWENDFDVEVIDLDTLDAADDADGEARHDGKPIWFTPVLNGQRIFKREHWHAVFVVSSLLLVGLLLFLNVQGITFLTRRVGASVSSRFAYVPPKLKEHLPAPISINPSLVLSASQLGLTCLISEAWSPDSASIAILGYDTSCTSNAQFAIGHAMILDAQSGRPLVTFSPDVPIRKAFVAHYSPHYDTLTISYDSLLWSLDKRHIAFTFYIAANTMFDSTSYIGVLVYDAQLKRSQVLIRLDTDIVSNQDNKTSYVEWDLVRGTSVPSPIYEGKSFIPNFNIPPGERYAWGNNGELVPQTRTPVAASSLGNMGGGPSFSLWQSGSVTFITQAYGSVSTNGVFVWTAYFLAWSPDERYLIQNAYTSVILEPQGYPKPTQKDLFALHLNDIPVVPVRDKGLLSAVNLLRYKLKHTLYTPNFMSVEWSPNGKLSWIMSMGTLMMTLYVAQGGFPIAYLLPQTKYKADAQSLQELPYTANYPNWSPDGQHIVSQDSLTNTISLWTLPHSLY